MTNIDYYMQKLLQHPECIVAMEEYMAQKNIGHFLPTTSILTLNDLLTCIYCLKTTTNSSFRSHALNLILVMIHTILLSEPISQDLQQIIFIKEIFHKHLLPLSPQELRQRSDIIHLEE
jgi:hypothetical protein